MSWTDERIALLKRMWKEGKSAAEIAKSLGKGVTRNAVIGKAHRMGLSGRPSPIKKPPAAKKETVKKPVVKRAAAAPAKKAAAPAAATKGRSKSAAPAAAPIEQDDTLSRIAKETLPPGGGVSLLDLTEKMCKWPIGDPKEPDFAFCGLPSRPGSTYCPAHSAAAYQTSSRSRAAAAREEVVVEVETDDDDDDVASEEE